MAKDWKKIVGSLAPTLATALGGPMYGTAVKFLSTQLLGKDNAKENEIEAAILGATPDQLAKLREIDNDFAAKMRELDIDVYRLEIEDRASARKLFEINIWPQIILTTIFTVGYFALMFCLFGGSFQITESIRDMCNILLGVMTAGVIKILDFWFGSSSGSKEKTAKLTQTKTGG